MTERQIIQYIKGYISDAQEGLSKENPKLDFKARWYNLQDEAEVNEFIKDTSAIANTPGLDGFIVIGYDDNTKRFTNASFAQSNLRDTSDLDGMIIKRVDRNYALTCYDVTIDGNTLSVLHIPPSFDKPHVIKNYKNKKGKEEQHRVFVRNGTITRLATKYDLDFIAYDRKNLMPEYSLFISTSKDSIHPTHANSLNIDLAVALIIENNGLRPVAITEIILTLFYENTTIDFISYINKEAPLNAIITASNLIIQPLEIRSFTGLIFHSQKKLTNTEFLNYNKSYHQFHAVKAVIRLNNGQQLTTSVQLV